MGGYVVRSGLVMVAFALAASGNSGSPERGQRHHEQGYTDREALDQFGGRQVWIDHGGGVVTTYNHLGAITPGIVRWDDR
jgi:murein DD-endopeptidase MepM/ murein hydrolase activator NlpD